MEIMSSMNHVESVIRIYGYFFDTPAGLVPYKVHKNYAFPVIVMEYMSGGPLFGRLNYSENVSEKYLANLFRSIAIAVSKLHEENFVHRDLKLDNVMFVDSTDQSPVRIIDLGMSGKLNSDGVHIDKLYLVGTPGFYAPESIEKQEYSPKTDIWQLGCMLYMLLSGLTPFHREKLSQITKRGYYKMAGKGWTDISESAKDLVHNLLKRRPSHRPSIEEILDHPWMKEASEAKMDDDYKTRIKRLALRDRMQKLFCENKLSDENAARQQSLIENVPMLKERSIIAHSVTTMSNRIVSEEANEFNGKLKKLKTMVVRRLSTAEETPVNINHREINYDDFVAMLEKCNLEELCTPAVFNIFDIGNTGTVDPKEFLMTMIAFRPVMAEPAPQTSDSSDADARLYFEMFDIKETGYIDMDELRIAVKFLLFMGTDEPQDLPDVEEMFNTIDLAKNGRIDFDEFKIFYKQLLQNKSCLAIQV